MTHARFLELLAIYGGFVAQWPEEYRADAMALLRQSPEARKATEAQVPFDNLLRMGGPALSSHRVDLAIASVMAATRPAVGAKALPLPLPYFRFPGAARGALYAGLMVLGGVVNLLLHVSASPKPIELLFSASLLPPLGG